MLDASTLGKLIVKGPDAGKFLDMLYTNMMSTLKVGKCRYGLMCNENGFLSMTASWRASMTTHSCATRPRAAPKPSTATWKNGCKPNGGIGTSTSPTSPSNTRKSRLLARMPAQRWKAGRHGCEREALGFMEWADGTLGGFDVRVYRISFSGELSYEIAVPASQGQAFWDALMAVGADLGAMPYGTECLHILRAEKGFIMIGDETDGTVIPQDLGLAGRSRRRKKTILASARKSASTWRSANRWKLVGLETVDGSTLPDGAYAVGEGTNANGQRNMIGRVTSSYHSPNLNKGIAMGLVLHGPDRMGEVITFPGTDGKNYEAKIVSPIFYDPEGEKPNV